ncbi:MAG: TnsA endonuclease N-terminal domain-containing protein [Fusicatenibacter sp.]
MRSYKKRIEEGRCQGIGANYVPLMTAREARSRGTSSIIYDPIEGRQIHTLSTVETNFYHMLRWNPEVLHIREQFLLDTEHMNKIAKEFGVPRAQYYTTDFLVDYKDGSKHAYSVKYSRDIFNINNSAYRGKEEKFYSLIKRQLMEKIYWESYGAGFSIITKEDINLDLVINVKNVMSCYQEFRVVNKTQKLMYLIAHRYISVPMDKGRLNFQELADKADFDIEDLYEKAITAREVYDNYEE